jgi:hypothetical protein
MLLAFSGCHDKDPDIRLQSGVDVQVAPEITKAAPTRHSPVDSESSSKDLHEEVRGSASKQEAFDGFGDEPISLYALAHAAFEFGAEGNLTRESVVLSGIIEFAHYPMIGYLRNQQAFGREQIQIEVTHAELFGESQLFDGQLVMGEGPEMAMRYELPLILARRATGHLVQETAGKDFPAEMFVEPSLLVATPKEVLHAPPTPSEISTFFKATFNEFPPIKLPSRYRKNLIIGDADSVRLADNDGNLGKYTFLQRQFQAYFLNPAAVYRMPVVGKLDFVLGEQHESIFLEGPIEFIQRPDSDTFEMIKMALRGQSKLLSGPIMIKEQFGSQEKFSEGRPVNKDDVAGLGKVIWNLYFDIESPQGVLNGDAPLAIQGVIQSQHRFDTIKTSDRGIPVYSVKVKDNFVSLSEFSVANSEKTVVGKVVSFQFHPVETGAGPRPCCPPRPKRESPTGTESRQVALDGSVRSEVQ